MFGLRIIVVTSSAISNFKNIPITWPIIFPNFLNIRKMKALAYWFAWKLSSKLKNGIKIDVSHQIRKLVNRFNLPQYQRTMGNLTLTCDTPSVPRFAVDHPPAKRHAGDRQEKQRNDLAWFAFFTEVPCNPHRMARRLRQKRSSASTFTGIIEMLVNPLAV